MNSSEITNGISDGAGNSDTAASSKRKASYTQDGPPMKVLKRSRPTAIKIKKLEFWDKPSPTAMTRAEVRNKFWNAAGRWEQLEKYKLLYKYSTIKEREVRLLYINPAPRREK